MHHLYFLRPTGQTVLEERGWDATRREARAAGERGSWFWEGGRGNPLEGQHLRRC